MKQLSLLLIVAVTSAALTALAMQWDYDRPKLPNNETPPLSNTTDQANIEHLELKRYAESLAAQLNSEREARQALEQEVTWLESMLDELTLATDRKAKTSKPKTSGKQLWFDQQALQKLGIDQVDIDNIAALVNKAELDKLELRNKATRDGQFRGRTFIQAMSLIQEELKSSLSTQDYDRMLYATGQNNRLSVSDTLAGSPAANVGIRIDDQIISYAGERIFHPSHLFRATTKGEAGEMIAVEILRNNERLTVYVPRGALGTRFRSIRAAPQ